MAVLTAANEFEAVLNDFKTAVTTICGTFYPDLHYGTLQKGSSYGTALMLCRANHAAEYIDGLYVKNISAVENGFRIDLYINETEGQVYIDFEAYT